MDIVLHNEVPSKGEREAVDAVLGPPESSWESGEDLSERDRHVARGGHAARARRHLLLPTLHAVQSRAGWISRGALNYICRRLTIPPAEAYGVATFYALFSLEPQPPVVAHICTDVACMPRGSGELCADLERLIGPEGQHAGNGQAIWLESPCLGMCERAPAALVTVAGEEPREHAVAPAEAQDIASLLAGGTPSRSRPRASRRPAKTGLRLLGRVGKVDPGSIDSYRAHGGYEGLRAALDMGQAGVLREVTDSKLVGRGGAAFPTGRKWDAVARNPKQPHYLICNADESEPGTFKDRVLLEHDPFFTIESMTIGGFATGAEHGYLYLRGEYPRGLGAPCRRDHRGPRARIPRPEHPRQGRQLRHRAAQGRRRLHLRRGDCALQLDRGLPGRAPQQAAVPGRLGAVRHADGDQQRRDAGQRAGHPRRRRAGLRQDRQGELHRHAPVLPLGTHRPARPVRGAVRDHAARAARDGRRRDRRTPAAHDHARGRGGALRDSRRARPRADLRGDPRRRARAWAPAS